MDSNILSKIFAVLFVYNVYLNCLSNAKALPAASGEVGGFREDGNGCECWMNGCVCCINNTYTKDCFLFSLLGKEENGSTSTQRYFSHNSEKAFLEIFNGSESCLEVQSLAITDLGTRCFHISANKTAPLGQIQKDRKAEGNCSWDEDLMKKFEHWYWMVLEGDLHGAPPCGKATMDEKIMNTGLWNDKMDSKEGEQNSVDHRMNDFDKNIYLNYERAESVEEISIAGFIVGRIDRADGNQTWPQEFIDPPENSNK